MFIRDENGAIKEHIEPIIFCKCRTQMKRMLNVWGESRAWDCHNCGKVHTEHINPIQSAMENLAAYLRANGVDLETQYDTE